MRVTTICCLSLVFAVLCAASAQVASAQPSSRRHHANSKHAAVTKTAAPTAKAQPARVQVLQAPSARPDRTATRTTARTAAPTSALPLRTVHAATPSAKNRGQQHAVVRVADTGSRRSKKRAAELRPVIRVRGRSRKGAGTPLQTAQRQSTEQDTLALRQPTAEQQRASLGAASLGAKGANRAVNVRAESDPSGDTEASQELPSSVAARGDSPAPRPEVAPGAEGSVAATGDSQTQVAAQNVSAREVEPQSNESAPSAVRALPVVFADGTQPAPRTVAGSPETPQRVSYQGSGSPVFSLNNLRPVDQAGSVAIDQDGNRVQLTIVPGLQLEAKALLEHNDLPWGALVALDPRTGRVLAMASYSSKEPFGGDLATRATFPAASLFKLVTAAAVIEQSGLDGNHTIFYRGGDYTLVRQNAIPDPRKDRRKITFAEALGRSVNPAFAHVALNTITEGTLERYAHSLGFNERLPFDAPIDISHFERPGDEYETARTAAGFGAVTLSPLHAAVLTATIANRGVMMKPFIIDHIVGADGTPKYQAHPTVVRSALSRSTAAELLSMMQATVDTGTAKRQFVKLRNPFLRSVPIAAKTGTLSGENPKGLYHWFVAAVPANNPEVVIAALIIESGGVRIHCSGLARDFLEYYFRDHADTLQTRSEPINPKATS